MSEPATAAVYLAVPDPDDPARMTYWRQMARGKRTPWPTKAQYGPVLMRADVPSELTGSARRAWVRQWFHDNAWPWQEAVATAIAADPDLCRARFAAFTTRCCNCGRLLTDEASKAYGIGPDCRGAMPDELLAQLTEAVGRLHAEALSTSAEFAEASASTPQDHA